MVVEVDGGGRRRAVVHKGREVIGCVVVHEGDEVLEVNVGERHAGEVVE